MVLVSSSAASKRNLFINMIMQYHMPWWAERALIAEYVWHNSYLRFELLGR